MARPKGPRAEAGRGSPEASALLRHLRAGDRGYGEQASESGEVARVRGEQRQANGDRGGSDHQVGCPAPGRSSGGYYGRGHLAEGPGRLGVEWDRVELVLGSLQHVEPTGALG